MARLQRIRHAVDSSTTATARARRARCVASDSSAGTRARCGTVAARASAGTRREVASRWATRWVAREIHAEEQPMNTKSKPVDANMTLVLGGTGKSGRRVAARLAARGRSVRIGSRTGTPPFDWERAETWPAAVQGANSVYVTYQPDLAFPGAAARVRAFVDVAVHSGVRRLVLLSGRNEEGAMLAEHVVRHSGLEWTIVRSSFFDQDFSEAFFLDPILGGELAFPAGDVAEPFIDVEDIVDIVVQALAGDQHVNRLYEVTGPRLITFAEAVREIAWATGRSIRYVPVSPQQFTASMVEHG